MAECRITMKQWKPDIHPDRSLPKTKLWLTPTKYSLLTNGIYNVNSSPTSLQYVNEQLLREWKPQRSIWERHEAWPGRMRDKGLNPTIQSADFSLYYFLKVHHWEVLFQYMCMTMRSVTFLDPWLAHFCELPKCKHPGNCMPHNTNQQHTRFGRSLLSL